MLWARTDGLRSSGSGSFHGSDLHSFRHLIPATTVFQHSPFRGKCCARGFHCWSRFPMRCVTDARLVTASIGRFKKDGQKCGKSKSYAFFVKNHVPMKTGPKACPCIVISSLHINNVVSAPRLPPFPPNSCKST